MLIVSSVLHGRRMGRGWRPGRATARLSYGGLRRSAGVSRGCRKSVQSQKARERGPLRLIGSLRYRGERHGVQCPLLQGDEDALPFYLDPVAGHRRDGGEGEDLLVRKSNRTRLLNPAYISIPRRAATCRW